MGRGGAGRGGARGDWACFHHTLPLIISGADDRQVKLWRMNGERRGGEGRGGAGRGGEGRGGARGDWACFHHTLPLIISGADDRQVKLWRMNGERRGGEAGWGGEGRRRAERGGARGDWACFHHTLPLIISGADDRQVKLWRMNGERRGGEGRGGAGWGGEGRGGEGRGEGRLGLLPPHAATHHLRR